MNTPDKPSEPTRPAKPLRRMKDSDVGDAAQKFRAFVLSGFGAIMGMFVGAAVGTKLGAPLLGTFIGFFGGWLITYLVSYGFAGRVGSAASGIYMPSGSTTPADRQYSLAQSFVARGKLDEAAAEYARCADAYPEDPEPALRLARLYRDELERHEDAVAWFRRACAMPTISAGTEIMAMRELIEVYTHRLKQPAAAMSWLSRLAAKHPDTAAGQWARRELQDLKTSLRQQPDAPA